jgi:hypothetical protein
MLNRYRSDSDQKVMDERKFQLILTALNFKNKVSVKFLVCEGHAMVDDYIETSD